MMATAKFDRSLPVVLALVVGATCTWLIDWTLRRAVPPRRDPSPTVQARAAADEEQEAVLAGIERRVAALETRSPSSPRLPTPAVSAAKVEAPRVPSNPPKRSPTTEQLDDVLETEGRDSAWARQYERDTQSALANAFKDEHVREVRCATSVCRIVVEHSTMANEADFKRRFWTALPDGYAGAQFSSGVDNDGTHTTSIRVIRKGYENALFETN